MKTKVSLPTTDEQKNLQQVEILMRTNLLTLQISELLVQVAGEKIFQKKKLHTWIEDLISDISSASVKIKKKGNVSSEISLQLLSKQKIKGLEIDIPSCESYDNLQLKIDFTAPSQVDLIGSYVNQTSTAPLLNIDITVVMPPEMFEPRDILNHAYFYKRKLYLYGLSRYLNEQVHADSEKKYTLSFSWFKGDNRKPILEVTPSVGFMQSNIVVRLIPTLATSVFKANQLRSEKNNVRPLSWMDTIKRNKAEGRKDPDLTAAALPPTPFYNMAILEDFSHLIQQRVISQAVAPFPAIRDAVILLKIWLTQRMLRFAADGFDSHHATLLMAYLLQTRRVSTQISALAAFQAALTFLAETDLASVCCDFTKTEITKATTDPIFNACLLFPLFDQSSENKVSLNVFWRLGKSTLLSLRSEAAISLRELQYNQDSCFQHLFMQRRSFFERHDIFFHFTMSSSIDAEISRSLVDETDPVLAGVLKQEENATLDRTAAQYFPDKVVDYATKALGDRVLFASTSVRCILVSPTGAKEEYHHVANFPSWRLGNAKGESSLEESKVQWIVSVGLILNKEKAMRRVERGPSAVTDSADVVQAFRDFWGPQKCQLRRFQDGAIIDAVVWDLDSSLLSTSSLVGDPAKRVQSSPLRADRVVDVVMRYIIGRYLPSVGGRDGQSLFCNLSSQLEDFCNHVLITPSNRLVNKNVSQELNQSLPTQDEHDPDTLTRHAVQALDQLRGLLTSQIKNLPLSFESLMAVTPELRYTSLVPVRPHPILLGKDAVKKHAGDVISLLCTPLRVLAKMESSGKWPRDAEAVAKCKTAFLLKTRTELRKQFEIHSVIHRDYLDVCYQGFIFRLVLVAGNETEVLPFLASIPAETGQTEKDRGKYGYQIYFHPNETCVNLEERAAIALNAVTKDTAVPPLHHLSVKALHAQHPSYSAAVRLLSVWAAYHYFSGHLCHEVLELITAHVYVYPAMAQAPNSALAGFYQALVRLSSHNWDSDPFIVDLSDSHSVISPLVRVQIVNSFRAVRSSGEKDNTINPSMYIVSSSDKLVNFESTLATKSPEKVVLGMILQAAKLSAIKLHRWISSAEYLPEQMDSERVADYHAELASIMSNSSILSSCNIVAPFVKTIVSPCHLTGPPAARLAVYANLSAQESSISNLLVKESTSTVNPIQEEVFEDLRDAFKEEAVFFWNAIKGKEVCVVWRPSLFVPKKFSVLQSKFVMPIDDGTEGAAATKRQKTEDTAVATAAVTVPNILEIVSHIQDSAEGLLSAIIFN